MVTHLSIAQARRLALSAQGFTDPKPKGRPDARTLERVLGRIGLLQIDSVNVLTRAHYLPLWSRIGAYSPTLLDRAAGRAPRRIFEYWAHAASYVPVRIQPALRHRMARNAADGWERMSRMERERPGFIEWVRSEVEAMGPSTARQIEDDAPRPKVHWGWNWSDVKIALEWLFACGVITTAGRNSQFERLYDLPERALPADVVGTQTPSIEDAHIELVRIAARAYGVATEPCLRDYFRLSASNTAAAIRALVEAGELVPAEVEGWKRPAYLHADAAIPRRVEARTLIGPFDSMVFERSRAEALFGFRYRIEIYVPKERRVYGYYVLPFLLGDRFVARVDLKADRTAGALLVQSAYAEEGAPPETAAELRRTLRELAEWLGLSDIRIADRGDLASALRSEQ